MARTRALNALPNALSLSSKRYLGATHRIESVVPVVVATEHGLSRPRLARLSHRARVHSILTGKSALDHAASRQRCGASHRRAKRLSTSSRGAGGRHIWRLPQRGRRRDPFDLPLRDALARVQPPEEVGCDGRLSFSTTRVGRSSSSRPADHSRLHASSATPRRRQRWIAMRRGRLTGKLQESNLTPIQLILLWTVSNYERQGQQKSQQFSLMPFYWVRGRKARGRRSLQSGPYKKIRNQGGSIHRRVGRPWALMINSPFQRWVVTRRRRGWLFPPNSARPIPSSWRAEQSSRHWIRRDTYPSISYVIQRF
jgi:hypothetical protein